MKLIDSLSMQERLILLALLGGNGIFWGVIAALVAYWLNAPSWVVVPVGAGVFYLVSVGALRFLEAIHDHKNNG